MYQGNVTEILTVYDPIEIFTVFFDQHDYLLYDTREI